MSGKTGNTRKILGSLLIVGVLGGLAGLGAFSAFTANTTNTGNSVASGTVKIDQDSSTTLYASVSNLKPSQTVERCVDVTYSGSLDANVYLYGTNVSTNGDKYEVKVERDHNGSNPSSPSDCASFSNDSTAFSNADLNTFPTAWGTTAGKTGTNVWSTGNEIGYRFTITRKDDPTMNAHTTATEATDSIAFTWEARNN